MLEFKIYLILVENKSIVTSGNYERYFIKYGKVYHHIINPKTGYPSESEIISTTIISDYSIDGDGLSIGVYIMGIEKSIKLIESLEGIDAIFITKNKEVYVTSGIKDNFKITNIEFTYKVNIKITRIEINFTGYVFNFNGGIIYINF